MDAKQTAGTHHIIANFPAEVDALLAATGCTAVALQLRNERRHIDECVVICLQYEARVIVAHLQIPSSNTQRSIRVEMCPGKCGMPSIMHRQSKLARQFDLLLHSSHVPPQAARHDACNHSECLGHQSLPAVHSSNGCSSRSEEKRANAGMPIQEAGLHSSNNRVDGREQVAHHMLKNKIRLVGD